MVEQENSIVLTEHETISERLIDITRKLGSSLTGKIEIERYDPLNQGYVESGRFYYVDGKLTPHYDIVNSFREPSSFLGIPIQRKRKMIVARVTDFTEPKLIADGSNARNASRGAYIPSKDSEDKRLEVYVDPSLNDFAKSTILSELDSFSKSREYSLSRT